MRNRHGCGPRGRFEINLPEGLMAMRGGRGWQGNWGPFNFDFGDEGWGGGGRRGRRAKRMFESGELRLVLLKLIADEPRHGYDLIRAIEELTGGEYAPSPGVVYPTLTLLQDMNLIEEAPVEGARKPFQATDEGRAHLEERSEEVEGLFERLRDLAPRGENMAGPAIGRAVRNLMTALGHRLKAEGFDEDLFLEVAAILDDAAQKIERVRK
ncbi:MAG TPA: PadR family transcriptional regulator [Sphingomicrobium sp.]|jgi:DNA-binding PadR family transcriptional regulator|nr:PadR family transcriptional regulator [Sphingomicrobium sp.]